MNSKNAPQFYVRYVDDIFAVFSDSQDIDPFLFNINSLHPNIKFTVEKSENTFPLLNVELKINGASFDSWVYRKKTHTGVMLNYSAIVPVNWKKGLILCLLNIAKKICSTPSLFENEVNNLRKMFQNNGYPLFFFEKVLEKFLNKQTESVNVNSDENEEFCILKIPFVGEASHTFGNKLKSLFQEKFRIKVKIIFTSFKVGNYFSLKSKTPFDLLSDVVYKYTCQRDAGISYLGKTKRHLTTRIEEHLNLKKTSGSRTAVTSHIFECFDCKKENHNFNIVKKCKNDCEAKIHEALLIRKFDPEINKQLFQKGGLFTL